MKIILNQDVYNLGEEGDVREVANGYARNYLLPKGLAVPYNNANIAIFKHKAAAIEKRKAEKREAALSQKERLENLNLIIKMSAGDSGKLFGAVTSQTVVDALAKEGIHVEKKRVEVPSHTIKMLGSYQVTVKLYEKEVAIVKITVVDERVKDEPAEVSDNVAAEPVEETVAEETEVETEVETEAAEEELNDPEADS